MSQDKMSRRSYLKYAGAAVAVGALAVAGYSAYNNWGKPVTPGPAGSKKKVKIGGTKPFTGPDAVFGISESNGSTLWAKMVNEAGGIKAGDGNTYEIELVLYNDEQKPENVPRLYEKLINDDKVDFLLGPVWGPLGMATVPVVEKYKKFEVYGTCSFDPLAYRDWRYIVHVITNGPEYMTTIEDMIIERVWPNDPEAKNIAIVYGDNMFARTVGVAGADYAKEKGFNVLLTESYNTATLTDFTPLLTKIKNAQPSIVLSAAEYAPAILMIKQMVELDLNLKLLWAGTGAVMQKYYEALTKYAEETITCTQWEKGMVFKQDYGPSHDEFIAAYMKEHNETPDYTCATGFQQGLVLQRAMELSKDPLNSDEVRKTAGEMDMTTFYGKFNVDPVTGWQIGHKMGVIQWRNGEKIVTWPMEANPQQLVYPMKKWKER